MIRVIPFLLMAGFFACAAPDKAEEAAKPKYTRTYQSENSVDINMPEMEEAGGQEEATARADKPAQEEATAQADKPAQEEATAQADEPAQEVPPKTEPEAAVDKPAELPAGSAWEEEFIKDMEGIKDQKNLRSGLTGDLVQEFPVGDEIQLGQGVAARMLHQTRELDNQRLWEYVTCLGSILAENSLRNDLAYHFVVLDDEEINAFAAPGGFIFVTKGAIKACENEAELASMLAHELAHVGLRHGIQMLDLSKYNVISKTMVSEMDKAFGQSEHYDLESSMPESLKKVEAALSEVADQYFQEMLNPYSREMELEADHEGMRILKTTGYNPHAAITLLERVAKASGDSHAPGMMALRTHPPTAERIDSLKRMAKEQGYRDEGVENRNRFQEYVKDL